MQLQHFARRSLRLGFDGLAMASIHEAARAGDLVALLSFLDADALSINARDRHSRTPYPVFFLVHGHCGLLRKYRIPPKWFYPRAQVSYPCGSCPNRFDVVHTLCKKHADVGAAAADNMAAIHFASQKGHTQVARYLLAAGASVTACTRKGMTPLHYAIQGGHLDMAKLLIKKGSNLNTQNKAGKKAIDFAKDDEFQSELMVAETERQEAKAAEKKSKSKVVVERGIVPERVAIEEKGGQTEDSSEKNDASPPRKKSKGQFSHLGMDQKLDEENS